MGEDEEWQAGVLTRLPFVTFLLKDCWPTEKWLALHSVTARAASLCSPVCVTLGSSLGLLRLSLGAGAGGNQIESFIKQLPSSWTMEGSANSRPCLLRQGH